MKKVVHKYELAGKYHQAIEMPIGAQILSVQNQRETPVIWALVDPDAEKETRSFVLVTTGESYAFEGVGLENRIDYIGTYQIGNGILVFHLFELVSKF